jgi:toxin ParE1/3/4
MSRLYFSPSAREDLNRILDHIAQDDPSAAINFVKKIKDVCIRIARFPEIGALRDDLAPELRCFPVKTYIIFYRAGEKRVDIVRVLHGSRDYSTLLK